ncbi:Helix-turn-helix domain-containing protein [Rhodococcoides kyotonense]|uniref:Helix-turn-helix domain-containing protein n=2 Tax=Rhodococcoides kyotonense TaxID=398843 RepID=A0A239IKG2_9NOCA|nr:Helix-turn-helix domain-containing protein [Rhodococcus kyotonensis]
MAAAFLRTHRRGAGLTLDDLAERTGLTKSYLSKVERGVSTPSISVALKIASALDADVGQLFSDEVDSGSMTISRLSDAAPGYSPIAPSQVGKAMQPFVVHPSASKGRRFMDHPGEEFVFVHSGTAEFEIPGRVTVLESGDSVYFDANTPHRLRSISDPAAVLLVVTYDNPIEGSARAAAHCGGSR